MWAKFEQASSDRPPAAPMQPLLQLTVVLLTFAAGGLYFLFVRSRLGRASDSEAPAAELEQALEAMGRELSQARLGAASDELEHELAQARQTIDRLERELAAGPADAGSEELTELSALRASLERRLAETAEHAEELEQALARAAAAHDGELRALRERLEQADRSSEVEALERRARAAERALRDLEQSSRTALEQAGRRMAEVDQALERAGDLKAELEAARARALSFEGISAELKSRLDRFEQVDEDQRQAARETRRSLEHELDAERAARASSEAQLEALTRTHAELQTRLAALEAEEHVDPQQHVRLLDELASTRARLASIEERAVDTALDPEAFVRRSELLQSEHALEQSEQRLQQAERELETLTTEVDNTRAALEEARTASERDVERRVDLEQQIEARSAELLLERHALEEARAELSDSEDRLAAERREREQLAERVASLEPQALRGEELANRVDELEPRLEQATAALFSSAAELDGARRAILRSEERSAALEDALDLLHAELARAVGEGRRRADRVAALEFELAERNQRLNDLEAARESDAAELAEGRTQLTRARAELDQEQQRHSVERSGFAERLAASEARSEGMAGELAQTREATADLRRQLESLRQDQADSERRASALIDELEHSEMQRSRLEHELSEHRVRAATLEGRLSQLNADLEARDAELARKHASLAEAELKARELAARLESRDGSDGGPTPISEPSHETLEQRAAHLVGELERIGLDDPAASAMVADLCARHPELADALKRLDPVADDAPGIEMLARLGDPSLDLPAKRSLIAQLRQSLLQG
jgi:chromosome segregation protein